MKIGSHNSWSYATPKQWWAKLIKFTAKCQRVDIKTQYYCYNARMFDFRIRFDNDGIIQIVHSNVIYNISPGTYYDVLLFLNKQKDVTIRVVLDIRHKKDYNNRQIDRFVYECNWLENTFKDIKFTCGECIFNKAVLYNFNNIESCEEKYASVCTPKLIDDWYPKWYAKRKNHINIQNGTDKEFLMIDFVDIT